MSEDPKYKLAFLLTQIGLRVNELRKSWKSPTQGPRYHSDMLTLIEACAEGGFEYLNENCEPVIVFVEAIKSMCRVREYLSLIHIGIYSYISSSNFIKNYSTYRKAGIPNVMISSNAALPSLPSFEYANCFLSKLANKEKNHSFFSALCLAPFKTVTELFFIFRPLIYILMVIFKKNPAPVVIVHIILVLMQWQRQGKLNEFEYCENKIRAILLLSYLLLPPMYNYFTKTSITLLSQLSPLLGTLLQGVVSFFKSYSFLL